jgi:hypothetical protein
MLAFFTRVLHPDRPDGIVPTLGKRQFRFRGDLNARASGTPSLARCAVTTQSQPMIGVVRRVHAHPARARPYYPIIYLP